MQARFLEDVSDELGVDLDEDMLMYIYARDISMSERGLGNV